MWACSTSTKTPCYYPNISRIIPFENSQEIHIIFLLNYIMMADLRTRLSSLFYKKRNLLYSSKWTSYNESWSLQNINIVWHKQCQEEKYKIIQVILGTTKKPRSYSLNICFLQYISLPVGHQSCPDKFKITK